MRVFGIILLILFSIIAFLFLGSAIVLSGLIAREEYEVYAKEKKDQQR